MIATFFGGIGGLALGVTGGAGAVLLLPLFLYILHISIHKALLLSLLIIFFSAVIGLIPHKRWEHEERRISFIVASGGLLMIPVGTWLSYRLSSHYLLASFAMLMAAVGVFLLLKEEAMRYFDERSHSHADIKELLLKRWPVLFVLGGISGFLSGLLGVGAGVLIVPALVLALMLPFREASKLSLLIVMVLSLGAFITHLAYEKQVDIWWLLSFVTGGMSGVLLGGYVSHFISTRLIQRVASFIVLATALTMLWLNLS